MLGSSLSFVAILLNRLFIEVIVLSIILIGKSLFFKHVGKTFVSFLKLCCHQYRIVVKLFPYQVKHIFHGVQIWGACRNLKHCIANFLQQAALVNTILAVDHHPAKAASFLYFCFFQQFFESIVDKLNKTFSKTFS